MIIDLIGNALEIPSDSGEEDFKTDAFDWDAYTEWKNYVTENWGPNKGYSDEKRIEVMTAVLKDDHMREVLRKAAKTSIRSQVGLTIDKYLSGEWSSFEASAQIVELDRE